MNLSTDVGTVAVRAVPILSPAEPPLPQALAPQARIELPLDQIVFRRAATAAQLRQIAHLRESIAMAPQLRQSAEFMELEKKEMRWALSAPSSAWTR